MAAEASVDGTPPVNRRFRNCTQKPTRSTHKEPRRVKRRCSGRGPALGVSPSRRRAPAVQPEPNQRRATPNGVEGPQPPRVFGFFLRVKKETAPSRAVATTKNKKHRKIPKTKPRANARQTLPKAQSSHHPHPHLSPHKKIYEKPLRACPRNGGTQWQPQSRTSRGRQA